MCSTLAMGFCRSSSKKSLLSLSSRMTCPNMNPLDSGRCLKSVILSGILIPPKFSILYPKSRRLAIRPPCLLLVFSLLNRGIWASYVKYPKPIPLYTTAGPRHRAGRLGRHQRGAAAERAVPPHFPSYQRTAKSPWAASSPQPRGHSFRQAVSFSRSRYFSIAMAYTVSKSSAGSRKYCIVRCPFRNWNRGSRTASI